MRACFPLLLGQNPTPDNHAKLLFTIGKFNGIPQGIEGEGSQGKPAESWDDAQGTFKE
jgi:hypothetical protein